MNKSIQILRSAVCLTVAVLAFGCVANASIYSAVGDFSIAGNPNGVWSYDYSGVRFSQVGGSVPGFNYWWDGQGEPDSSIVGLNVSGSPIPYLPGLTLPTNYLVMDPEGNSDVEVLFTAPTAGSYSITGNFLAIDANEHDHAVGIFDNGNSIFSSTISSYGQSDGFSLNETLNAGDTIGFVVDTGYDGIYYNLSTGLAATISSPTPEPKFLWATGLGLAGLFLLRRR
jgi:MYXO-CTERM domain-containing protein